MEERGEDYAIENLTFIFDNESGAGPNSSFINATQNRDYYIFNRWDTRVSLVISYTLVFCCCFFGNLLVITVVILHRRMRTITNFFLTNLAVADMCVSLFCVYQNLSFYLTNHWSFGDFFCKMYHFVHSLSYTASIITLIVMSVERYVAICHPMISKQLMTLKRLRKVCISVWLASAAYCSPRLVMYGTIEVPSDNGNTEIICVLKRSFYDTKTYDIINFIVCFFIPLLIMTVLYFLICLRLWRSNQVSRHNCAAAYSARATFSLGNRAHSLSHIDNLHSATNCCAYDLENVTHNSSFNGNDIQTSGTIVRNGQYTLTFKRRQCSNGELRPIRTCRGAKNYVLKSRRKVIRLLVTVVLTFAFCNLPFHARKFWQNWSPGYDGTSSSSIILTITTTLILYMNSAINPFLYALLSENFRESMTDVVLCRSNRLHNSRTATRLLIRDEPQTATVRSISFSQEDAVRN